MDFRILTCVKYLQLWQAYQAQFGSTPLDLALVPYQVHPEKLITNQATYKCLRPAIYMDLTWTDDWKDM